jgi:hypothetical protein
MDKIEGCGISQMQLVHKRFIDLYGFLLNTVKSVDASSGLLNVMLSVYACSLGFNLGDYSLVKELGLVTAIHKMIDQNEHKEIAINFIALLADTFIYRKELQVYMLQHQAQSTLQDEVWDIISNQLATLAPLLKADSRSHQQAEQLTFRLLCSLLQIQNVNQESSVKYFSVPNTIGLLLPILENGSPRIIRSVLHMLKQFLPSANPDMIAIPLRATNLGIVEYLLEYIGITYTKLLTPNDSNNR